MSGDVRVKARVIGVVVLVALTAGGAHGGEPAEQLVFVRGGDLWASAPDGGDERRLTRSSAVESRPALAPDGARLAFASNRSGEYEVYATAVDPWSARALSRNRAREDVGPAWSPDGRRLAWSSAGDVYSMNAAGNARTALAKTSAAETDPTWSPDGAEVAYAADGDIWITRGGTTLRQLTSGPQVDSQPDWSSRGVLAFIRDGAVFAVDPAGGAPRQLSSGPADSAPAWSPDGDQLVFARAAATGSDLLVVGATGSGTARVVVGASDPDWGRRALPEPEPEPVPPVSARELLPDLDQRAPTGLTVSNDGGRFKLGFVSAADNIGRGPVWIISRRRSAAVPAMTAFQYVELRGGGRRIHRNRGVVRYTWSSTHSHWHYLRFMAYELRRAGDFSLVVRDRKSGFCLADHYGLAAARLGIPRPRPRFLGNCAQGNPGATLVEQGNSVGYTDRYPAHLHGQNVDITGVRAGTYWLVHRANPSGALRELSTANNAASLLIRIGWPRGRASAPAISVLRVCEGAERCGLTPP